MAAQGPVEQTLRVFETIDAHFKANPKLLNTDGIFRISSAGRKHIELAEAIQAKQEINWDQYSVHDCANALKYVLLQVRLLPAQDERVQLFMDLIQDPNNHQKALKQFIEGLHNTENELQTARIINIALDICRRTTIQEKYNRMSPKNLSVVWGPAFQHCFNMEPKGDDLSSQIFFTMNQLNPAIEEGIRFDLPKVVPVVVDHMKRTITEAAELYKNSQAMLVIANNKMTQLRMQQKELQKIIEVKMSLLKKGGLSRQEKKDLKNNIIPKLKAEIINLEIQVNNWKIEAKRFLDIVVHYEEQSKDLTDSFDRLEIMLSDMTPSGSDKQKSVAVDLDELVTHKPVLTTQYDQQGADELAQDVLEHTPASADRARANRL